VGADVRRCARALAGDGVGNPLRLAAIIRQWCQEEVRMSELPVAKRDVCSLDVPRWPALFGFAGLALRDGRHAGLRPLFRRYALVSHP
jgi:hypothetical protein